MDLDEIWRSDWTGVPGFSPEPLARDLLMMVGRITASFTDRPKFVCALLAQFGRHANDTLCQASAIERRAHYIVDGVMRGILEGSLGSTSTGWSLISCRRGLFAP